MADILFSEASRPIEQGDDLRDPICKAHHGLRHFSVRKPNFRLVEHYERGDLCVAVRKAERDSPFGTKSSQDGFVFQALNLAGAPEKHTIFRPTRVTAPKEEARSIRPSRNQAFVFPQYVELVEGPNGVIPSLVWPERFDRDLIGPGKPLFAFDACQRIDHFLLGGKDRKVRVSVRILAVPAGECRSEQVQGGPDAIDDGANFGVHDRIEGSHQCGNKQLFSGLRIVLDVDVIKAFVGGPVQEFCLEDFDLGYGPVNGGLGV
jgi:hypothetical protein